ncbi:TonB-dependent siderophore receptor [Stenotrophomonas sp.]|uniref:TonB-dependent siderophore receptor n=1 Tax=Stenotrophomonas sp. TaxID=69392 RepID=UPI0028A7906E|nr:TonB-dependent siderophore receptor [Stenotrophomonas sp.]
MSTSPRVAGRRPALISVAIALALSTPAALAAETGADVAQTLDAVQVNAYRTTTHASGATKTDTAIAETAKSVSVIAREEMDARGVTNLNEAMRYVAGVVLESTGNDNRYDDFRIRGFSAGSESDNVTIDGLRAPPIGTAWNRTKIDSWNLDRVEVLKGPSAVMYGQVAPGGMVNQVSKTPTPDQQQVLQLGVDGHGTYSAAFDVGAGSSDDQHLFRLVGRYSDGGTQIDTVEQQHWFIAPSYTFQIADKTRLTLLGMYQEDDGGSTYQFLPMDGTLLPTAHGHMDNTTFIGEPGWDTFDRTVWTAGWLFEHAFNDSWTLSQSARRMHVDSLYRGIVTNGGLDADGRTQARRQVAGTGDADGTTLDTRLTGKFSTGAAEHTLLFGFDWQQGDYDNARLIYAPPASIDIFEPVHTGPTNTLNTVTYTGGKARQSGVYLQDQMSLGNWRLTLGGRYDRTDDNTWSQAYNAVTGKYGARTPSRVKDDAVSLNAGVLYVFDNGFSPYLSYSESFQPSSYDSTYSYTGQAFDPVRGKQWEAGVKYQPASFDGLFTLAAYDLRQKDVAVPDTDNGSVCGPTGTTACRIGDGETRVRGIELEARVTPVEGFSVIGAASRMDSEYVRSNNSYEGKDVEMVPDWMGSLWGDYTFQSGAFEGFSIATGLRYNGETHGVGTARGGATLPILIPSYTQWDAAIRFDLSRVTQANVLLSLNLSNIADKRFVTTCTGISSCWYGSGRTVTANARWTW